MHLITYWVVSQIKVLEVRMKILLLGGTVFLGNHLVQAALKAGHEVTIFTRGITNAELFSDVEKLHGNRDGNLASLEGKKWDAVIDTSGYVPRIVRDSAKLLADSVQQYTFISSVSVYKDLSQPGVSEGSSVGELEDKSAEEVSKYYGELKALCEQAVEDEFPGRALHIRPGLIVGPQDSTDRFTYWPTRIHKGGNVLAPGNPNARIQIIDVRDLAEWVIQMVDDQQTGVYNATGPDYMLTMKDFLEKTKEASNSNAVYTWVSEDFLMEQGVGPWMEMPLWIPPQGETAAVANLMSVNTDKAIAAGLKFRPLKQTVQDTLQWDLTRQSDLKRKAGMASEREEQLLRDWNSSQN
jgi:2'-hydroxyisoflavone reductase